MGKELVFNLDPISIILTIMGIIGTSCAIKLFPVNLIATDSPAPRFYPDDDEDDTNSPKLSSLMSKFVYNFIVSLMFICAFWPIYRSNLQEIEEIKNTWTSLFLLIPMLVYFAELFLIVFNWMENGQPD
jgi:hypothetical protein